MCVRSKKCDELQYILEKYSSFTDRKQTSIYVAYIQTLAVCWDHQSHLVPDINHAHSSAPGGWSGVGSPMHWSATAPGSD